MHKLLRATVLTLLLALPWLVLATWLALTVGSFDHSRAMRESLAALFIAAACVIACRSLGWRIAWLVVLAWLALLLLAFADAASWFIQAASFNAAFFAHMDWHNLASSARAMPLAAALAAVGLLASLVVGIGAIHAATRMPLKPWWLLLALALLYVGLRIDAPPRRLVQYIQHARHTSAAVAKWERTPAGRRVLAMLETRPSSPDEVRARPGRNVVWIYLESIERAYLDTQRFPGLMPNINRLRQQGLDFTGLQTFPGITYTIAGLFSSQCGAPYLIHSVFGTSDIGKLHFVPGNDSITDSNFHPELACFGDVLDAAGYDQTLVAGSNLDFTRKRELFQLHGYDHTLGLEEIQAMHDGKLPVDGWGLHDDDLYHQALVTYRKKEKLDQPFSLVIETVDTHRPEGFVVPRCEHYSAIDNPMLDAVHCADQLVGRFIGKLSREPAFEDTVIVVMGDHIAMYNTASRLYPPDSQRQPFMMVLHAGQGVRDARMYHMDVAPTVLGLMGVASNVRFMAGEDRSAADAPDNALPANDLAVGILRTLLWHERPEIKLCRDKQLIHWDGDALVVDALEIPITLAGTRAWGIPDNRALLVFIDQRNAHAQLMKRGNQSRWVAKAIDSGRSVFKATPFWNDAGQRRLALDWLAPSGAWASLGVVTGGGSIQLASPQCDAMLDALAAAKPGERLDFSEAFGLPSIPAAREPRPGAVRMHALPAHASSLTRAVFMFNNISARKRAYGDIQLTHERRILLQPSPHQTAWIEFDVSHLASLALAPQINPLMGSCKTRSDTGIVGFSASLDGKPVIPRFILDRDYHKVVTLDTRGAETLRISVDKGNDTTACDWFAIGFPHIELDEHAAVAGAASSAAKPQPMH